MPVLILLGIFTVYGVYSVIDAATPSAKEHDKKKLDRITDEMIGKSQSECRKILKKYRGWQK